MLSRSCIRGSKGWLAYGCCVSIFGVSFFVMVGGLNSGRDATGVSLDGGEDAVAFAAGGFEVGGFEGEAMSFFVACVGVEGEVQPPGSVVVPEVVVGVAFGAAVG